MPKQGATNETDATQDQIYSLLAQGNVAKLGQPLRNKGLETMPTICFGLFIMVCQAKGPAPAPASSYCDIAKPIYWNVQDTRKTKEAIDTPNRVYKRLCMGQGEVNGRPGKDRERK